MLKYNNIILSTVDSDIAEEIREQRNNPDLFKWFRQPTIISASNQINWIDKIQNDSTIQMYSVYGEVDKDTCLVGVVGLTSIDYIHSKAELSIYIFPEYFNRGFGTEACKAILDIGFNTFNLNRIWAEVFEGNPAIKLYEKVGFILEGTLRQTYYKCGKYINSLMYSILKEEFI